MLCGRRQYVLVSFFFFFKQKTAYEVRISDWSSDVCSSDLPGTATTPAACRRPDGTMVIGLPYDRDRRAPAQRAGRQNRKPPRVRWGRGRHRIHIACPKGQSPILAL